jgi:hypothetical protein
VEEVEVDVEEVRLAVPASDDVGLPHLLGQRSGHDTTSTTGHHTVVPARRAP